MKKVTLYILALAPLLFACKKDKDENPKDTQNPVFTALRIEGEDVLNATEEIEVHLGEAFEFEVSVSDDVELNELQVSIHNAFDSHGHEHRVAVSVVGPLSWGPVIRTLSGKEATQSFSVFNEEDNYAYGEYHLEMVVLDKAGNRTEKVIEFHLEGHEGEDHVH